MTLRKTAVDGYVMALGGLQPAVVFDALAGLWRDADTKAMPTPGMIRERIRSDYTHQHGVELLPDPQLSNYDMAFGLQAAPIHRRALDPRDPFTVDDADAAYLALACELGPQYLGRGGDGAEVRMKIAIEESQQEFGAS